MLKDWIVGKTVELNQPVNFNDVLISEGKQETGYAFISTGKKKLWVPLQVDKKKIRHDKEKPPKDLDYGQEKGD